MSNTDTQSRAFAPPTSIGSREKRMIIRQLVRDARNEIVVDEHGILRIPEEVVASHRAELQNRRNAAVEQLQRLGVGALAISSILKLDSKDVWYLSGFVRDQLTEVLIGVTSDSGQPFSDPQVQDKVYRDALERASRLFIPRSLALIESIPGIITPTQHTPLSAFMDSLRPRPTLHTWTYQAEPYVYEAVLRELGTRYLSPKKAPETTFETIPSRYAGVSLADPTKTRTVLGIHESFWRQMRTITKKRLCGLIGTLEDYGTSYEHVIGVLEPLIKVNGSLRDNYPLLHAALARFQQTGESKTLELIVKRIDQYNSGEELPDDFSLYHPEDRVPGDLPRLSTRADVFDREISEISVASRRPKQRGYSDAEIEYFYRSKVDVYEIAMANFDPDDPYFFDDLEYLYESNPDAELRSETPRLLTRFAADGKLVRRFPAAVTIADSSTLIGRTSRSHGILADEPDFGTFNFDERRDPWRFLAAVVEDRIRQKGEGWKPQITSVTTLRKMRKGHAPFLRETLSAIGEELDIDPEVMFAPYVAANEAWKNVCSQMKVIFGSDDDQLSLNFPEMEAENWQDLRAFFRGIKRDRSFMWANDAVSSDIRRFADNISLFKEDGKAFKQLRESFSMNKVATAIVLGTTPAHIELVELGIVSVTTLEPTLLRDMLDQARVRVLEITPTSSVSRPAIHQPELIPTPSAGTPETEAEGPENTPDSEATVFEPTTPSEPECEPIDLETSIDTIAKAFVQLGYDIGQRDSSAGVRREISAVVDEIKRAFERE